MAADTRRWTASCSSRPACTGTPSSTTSRPATTVCRAATGPQRSHASTGSDSAPAKPDPSSGQTTRSPQAPDRQLADLAGPAEARRAAAGGDLQGVPGRHRRRRRAAACPAASPSGPPARARRSRPTPSRPRRARPARRPPAARRPAPARCPGSCWTTGSAPPRPAPRPAGSTSSGVRPDARAPARPGRSSSRRRRGSRPAAGRTCARQKSSSSCVSHRWVCSRTSSRSASSAVRAHQRRRDAERRARAPARCGSSPSASGRGGAPPAAAESARISSSSWTTESGGSPPSLTDSDIEPRVGWKRMPRSRAAAISARDQVAGAARVHVQVVGRGGAAAERQLGEPDVGADVRGLLVQPRPQRVQRDQPVEQAAGQRGGERAGQVLVQVVVGVDQARRDQAAARVDACGRRPAAGRPGRRRR